MHNHPTAPYLKIQDWAEADRPREKMIQQGHHVLTDAELLGILIGSGTSKVSAVALAQHILKHYENDLNLLAQASVKELQRFKGIGVAKAINIVSAMELHRRRKAQDAGSKPKLYDSRSAYQLIKADLLDKRTEAFWIMLINRGNYLIRKQCISTGGLAGTLADPKVIFKAALDHHAAGIILVHNHPSGNPPPARKILH